jgi:hypothetical protein
MHLEVTAAPLYACRTQDAPMEPVIKKVRARVRGRQLELLEDVDLPADREVTVGIEMPPTDDIAEVVAALRASAGAWSDEAHPELRSREDAVRFVRGLRAGFDRGL